MIEHQTDENFTVHAVHDAPPDLVFTAMTTPEHLTHFWGPEGTHTPLEGIVVDLRPGGTFSTTMVSDRGGHPHTMRAAYLEVDRPEFLSWREVDSGVVTELRFVDLGDGRTEVETTQRGLPPAWRTPEARAGWGTALDRFAAYLTSLQTDASNPERKP
ncbi:MAG TPA: SRPBCC domain-containing protein [Lapillicoccus sp.]|nr:SRPBCC domain-containing protein [Lapillicoccus sp.]